MNLILGQEQRGQHREQTCGYGGERDNAKVRTDIYTTMCKADSQLEPAIQLSLVLCDDLDVGDREVVVRREVRGRSKREGMHVQVQLIHFIVQQTLAQHCKEIILQFKRKEKVNPIQKKSTKNFNSYPTIFNLIQIFLLILLLTLYKHLGTCVQLSQDKFCDFIHFSPSLLKR